MAHGQPYKAERLIDVLRWYGDGLIFLGLKEDESKTLLVLTA